MHSRMLELAGKITAPLHLLAFALKLTWILYVAFGMLSPRTRAHSYMVWPLTFETFVAAACWWRALYGC